MHIIDREACLQQFPALPQSRYDPATDEQIVRFPEVVAQTVFILPASSFSKLALRSGKALSAAMSVLNVDSLIFLGENDIAWRWRAVTYPPALRGLQYLALKGVDKQFAGGLRIEIDELPEAMRHLLWLIRTNTVLPAIWFTDPRQRFIVSPCQHGGLHLSILNAHDEASIRQAFSGSGFKEIDTSVCNERFAARGIPGRTIPV